MTPFFRSALEKAFAVEVDRAGLRIQFLTDPIGETVVSAIEVERLE